MEDKLQENIEHSFDDISLSASSISNITNEDQIKEQSSNIKIEEEYKEAFEKICKNEVTAIQINEQKSQIYQTEDQKTWKAQVLCKMQSELEEKSYNENKPKPTDEQKIDFKAQFEYLKTFRIPSSYALEVYANHSIGPAPTIKTTIYAIFSIFAQILYLSFRRTEFISCYAVYSIQYQNELAVAKITIDFPVCVMQNNFTTNLGIENQCGPYYSQGKWFIIFLLIIAVLAFSFCIILVIFASLMARIKLAISLLARGILLKKGKIKSYMFWSLGLFFLTGMGSFAARYFAQYYFYDNCRRVSYIPITIFPNNTTIQNESSHLQQDFPINYYNSISISNLEFWLVQAASLFPLIPIAFKIYEFYSNPFSSIRIKSLIKLNLIYLKKGNSLFANTINFYIEERDWDQSIKQARMMPCVPIIENSENEIKQIEKFVFELELFCAIWKGKLKKIDLSVPNNPILADVEKFLGMKKCCR